MRSYRRIVQGILDRERAENEAILAAGGELSQEQREHLDTEAQRERERMEIHSIAKSLYVSRKEDSEVAQVVKKLRHGY